MKILMCYLWNKNIDSGNSLRNALMALGHKVITCGPDKGNYDGKLTSGCDIKVYDKREHPETYTYKEILEKSDSGIDFILQTDPNFYLVGEKPRNIISAYYLIDVHRGGNIFREMALKGSFNVVFLAHKYFIPLFEMVGLNVFWLPRAYDDSYIYEYKDIEPEIDLTFCGRTGLLPELEIFDKMDTDINRRYHEGPFPDLPPEKKFIGWDNRSMEYSARAEILMRLSRDFKIRIYEETIGPEYTKIICKGKITVNRSLWLDSALRNFEVMACNRFLITDDLPYQRELFQDKIHCRTYRNYYQPQFSNFDLDYECIRDLVQYYLTYEAQRNKISYCGMQHVQKYHSFKRRAEHLINVIDGIKRGQYEHINKYSYL